jgi:hypothetical protein
VKSEKFLPVLHVPGKWFESGSAAFGCQSHVLGRQAGDGKEPKERVQGASAQCVFLPPKRVESAARITAASLVL